MKTSLYIRIRNKALGLFFILMPYFFCTSALANPLLQKTDSGSFNLTDTTVSSSLSVVSINKQKVIIPDTYQNSYFDFSYLLNNNSYPNSILHNALFAPPSITCPLNIISNTDPGVCKASLSGLAAIISDPDGDITTITWKMTGATFAASPNFGQNVIPEPFIFFKGITTVTYIVTDAGGSVVSCSFTVTVNDTEKPAIVCPADVSIPISSCALLTDTITFNLLSLSDNCGILNFNSNAPVRFPPGITNVIWTANDNSGNSSQCTQIVTVNNDPPIVVIIFNQTNVACMGSATGSVTVSVSGGAPPYQYNLNGGAFQASSTFNNLLAGTYTILVRDANNCTSSVPVTITQSATALTASITSQTNVLCATQANGRATVTASGGTSPFTYSWNTTPVQTSATAINLTARAYTVTVTDALGCISTANVTITQPTPIIVTISKTDVSCFGDSTGTATALASGGVPPYSYAWLTVPLQTTATASNLPAGTYTVAVFDAVGCFKPAFVTITQPSSKFIASITTQVNVACAGNNTGLLTVTGGGGVAPYQYNINGGAFQPGSTFNNLGAGNYTIIARDANNCSVNLSATITAPATALTASITSQTDVLCATQATGGATVTASGGTSPYIYSWNTTPVQSSATAINLTARAYTVTVTDALGCISTANVTITQPTPIIVTISKTDVSCFGDSTGTATALASGGVPPYSYAWLTVPLQATATASNLPAGTYTVAVFDAVGCFKPAFVTITQPASKFIASITTQVNVTCTGNNTGTLTVTGGGGVAPYQYNINGGAFQPGSTFNNLSAGNYTIIARDANNCSVNLSATIIEPATALTASITSQTDVLCATQATGGATVTASGGTSPYIYSWNTTPVQSSATAINLTARAYTVTVTDALGCISTANVTISQPTPIIVTISKTDVSCFGDSTGTATALASGGVPPYSYSWLTVPIQATATASDLPAGTYTVAVFDAEGCFKPAFVTITQPAFKLTASITDQINVACAGNTGSLTVAGSGGTAPYQYNINGGTFQVSGIFTNLGAGNYTLMVRDTNNCTFNVPATITEPANALRASITSQTNVLCIGEANGSATVTATNGNAPYSYSWNTIPVQTTETISNLTVGTYIVTTTDNTNCTVTDTAFITEPALALTVSVTNQVNYDCASGTNGSVTVEGAGGTPNYQYSIDAINYQVSSTFPNLPLGNYTLTVKDTNNCLASVSVEIIVSGLILADAGLGQMLCNSDVAALVGNSAGTGIGSWTYISGPNVPSVSPSTGNVAIASGLIPGTTPYIFSYSIITGICLSTDTMSVINYIPVTPAFAGTDQNLCTGSGNITTTLAANTPTIGTGSWTQLAGPGAATIQDATNPNTDVSDLSPGVYTFQWLITNGVCLDDADVVTISVAQGATVNAGIDLSTCESAPVQVSGSSVQNNASILWTTGGDGTFNDPALIDPIYTPGLLDIAAGTIKLTLNAAGSGPCPDVSDFAFLTINKKPHVDAGPDDGICIGNSKTISLSSASDYSNLQWSVTPASAGILINPETLNPTFTPAAGFTGIATLTLSAQGFGACITSEDADAMNIEVIATLVADAGTGQTIPPGASTELTGSVSGGSGFYSWSWQPASLLVNPLTENPVTVALDATTTFTLNVLDLVTGCIAEASVVILVDNEANPLVAVADYDTTLVNASVIIEVLTNDINPNEDPLVVSICGFPSHGIAVLNSDNTITYTPFSDYEGEDELCYKICSTINPILCADSKVYLNVKHPALDDLFPYNGISPNSDGINDVWKIRGIEKYPVNTVLIFNRWGDKIREFANYNNTTRSWNGKNENDDPLPDGTYFYILDVKDVGVLKGWIYIRGK